MAVRLYWWSMKREDGKENYGDLLSKYIVEKVSKQPVIHVKHPSQKIYKYFLKHYLSIGSIISQCNHNSIVWGSGIIFKNQEIKKAKFLAVRGPYTRNRILELGYSVPEVYGDPAILLPLYYKNGNIKKKFKIGIIPHYVDYKEVKEVFKDDSRIKVINLLTDNLEATTDEILECENIISSSLHGVIVSQAYEIPSLWIKFSEKLAGDNIKFYDYFESVGLNFKNEIAINPSNLTYELMEELLSKNNDVLLPKKDVLKFRREQLLINCPFKK